MELLLRRELGDMVACIAHSTRVDGDLSPSTVPAAELSARRSAAVALTWRAVHQVHSDRVVIVDHLEPAVRPQADALVTSQPGLALAVHSGDCVPVGFISDAGAVACAHAGWKGLEAGVLESTVRTLRAQSGSGNSSLGLTAAVGPHIRKDSYEFSREDLDRLVDRFGSDVEAETPAGMCALDLTAAIANELERLDVHVAAWSPDCTAEDSDRYWSHRARKEPGRIALVSWLEPATAAGSHDD